MRLEINSPQGHIQETLMGGGHFAAVDYFVDLLEGEFAGVFAAQLGQVRPVNVHFLATFAIFPMTLSAIVLEV